VRTIFFGTPDFAVPTLRALCADERLRPAVVVTQPDRPAGRGGRVSASPIKQTAGEFGLKVLQPQSLRKELQRFLPLLEAEGPFDVGVVVAFGQILPQQLLDLPRAGFVNVHASLLPRWRGAAPIQRAILAGDRRTGISLMRMEAGLDSGPVYCTRELPIDESDDHGSLHDKLAEVGAALLRDRLSAIVEGGIKPAAQDESRVTYARKVENDEARIDWTRGSEEIARQVRAFSPQPGAFTLLGEKRLKILKACAKAVTSGAGQAAAGEVVQCGAHAVEVRCGSGLLSLELVQLAGRRSMTIDEFVRGAALDAGMRLQ